MQVDHVATASAIPPDQKSGRWRWEDVPPSDLRLAMLLVAANQAQPCWPGIRGSRATGASCAVSLRSCPSKAPGNYGTNLGIARPSLVMSVIYLRTIEHVVADGLASGPFAQNRLRG